jgi:BirA family biotin operon repressor/biotin-[acetyl-CoA-carboxylase] ligase
MRVLTDDPSLAAALVPQASSTGWRRDPTESADIRMLVDALGGTAVWSQHVRAGDFWSTVAVVSHSAGSQFDVLDALLRDGWHIAGPTAALAVEGTGFRGQHGRAWEAARGNLHVSAAVPVGLDVAHLGAALSMLPAVAAIEAIAHVSGGAIRPGIKWVNDILIDDRKVGGVLTAAHTTTRRVDVVIWGVGINVEVAPAVTPTPFVPATTCLHEASGGAQITVTTLFRALLEVMAARHVELGRVGWGPLYAAYRAHSMMIGRTVRVWDEFSGALTAEGVVVDVASDLRLQIEGQHERVSKGRLELVPRAAAAPVDHAVVAAIAAAVTSRFPGATVTRIEAEP